MAIFSKTIQVENQNTLSYIFLKNGNWQPKNAQNATILQASSDKIVFDKVLSLIRNAENSICLQSFLIQDSAIIDELVKATERGVRVFVTSAAEARLKPTIEEEPSFIKDNYKKMLHEKFKFRFVHRSAENLHAKFIVVDGRTNPKGMIFTNNFTDNGFFKNPELAVMLTPEQAKELYKVFVYYFWERTTDEQTANNEFERVQPLGKFELPNLSHLLVSSDKSLKKTMIQAIEKAEKRIVLSTFSLDSEFEICKKIVEKQQKNLPISIFTRLNNKQLQSQTKPFLENSAAVYLHPTTHAKFILTDDTGGYIFTANFNQHDFETGFNVGVKLSKQQAEELSQIVEDWKSLLPYKWKKSKPIKSLKEYLVFENEKLTSRKIELMNFETEKKQVKTVAELNTFFKKKRTFVDNSYQCQQLTLSAELENFTGKLTDKNRYEVKENKNVTFVTEFEKIRDKTTEKRKFIVVNPQENVENLIKILENQDAQQRIYAYDKNDKGS